MRAVKVVVAFILGCRTNSLKEDLVAIIARHGLHSQLADYAAIEHGSALAAPQRNDSGAAPYNLQQKSVAQVSASAFAQEDELHTAGNSQVGVGHSSEMLFGPPANLERDIVDHLHRRANQLNEDWRAVAKAVHEPLKVGIIGGTGTSPELVNKLAAKLLCLNDGVAGSEVEAQIAFLTQGCDGLQMDLNDAWGGAHVYHLLARGPTKEEFAKVNPELYGWYLHRYNIVTNATTSKSQECDKQLKEYPAPLGTVIYGVGEKLVDEYPFDVFTRVADAYIMLGGDKSSRRQADLIMKDRSADLALVPPRTLLPILSVQGASCGRLDGPGSEDGWFEKWKRTIGATTHRGQTLETLLSAEPAAAIDTAVEILRMLAEKQVKAVDEVLAKQKAAEEAARALARKKVAQKAAAEEAARLAREKAAAVHLPEPPNEDEKFQQEKAAWADAFAAEFIASWGAAKAAVKERFAIGVIGSSEDRDEVNSLAAALASCCNGQLALLTQGKLGFQEHLANAMGGRHVYHLLGTMLDRPHWDSADRALYHAPRHECAKPGTVVRGVGRAPPDDPDFFDVFARVANLYVVIGRDADTLRQATTIMGRMERTLLPLLSVPCASEHAGGKDAWMTTWRSTFGQVLHANQTLEVLLAAERPASVINLASIVQRFLAEYPAGLCGENNSLPVLPERDGNFSAALEAKAERFTQGFLQDWRRVKQAVKENYAIGIIGGDLNEGEVKQLVAAFAAHSALYNDGKIAFFTQGKRGVQEHLAEATNGRHVYHLLARTPTAAQWEEVDQRLYRESRGGSATPGTLIQDVGGPLVERSGFFDVFTRVANIYIVLGGGPDARSQADMIMRRRERTLVPALFVPGASCGRLDGKSEDEWFTEWKSTQGASRTPKGKTWLEDLSCEGGAGYRQVAEIVELALRSS